MSETLRMCTRCGEVKPIAAFAISAKARSGRSKICKLCRNVEAKAYRDTHGRRQESVPPAAVERAATLQNFRARLRRMEAGGIEEIREGAFMFHRDETAATLAVLERDEPGERRAA